MAESGTNVRPKLAPDFKLLDTSSGEYLSLEELKSDKATVIMFICNHCPYVKHVEKEIIKIANEYTKKGASFIAISSNDPESYPEDGPQKMKEKRYPFPYLFDESQEVAKAYGATCTPDFFIFDGNLACVYHGRLDETTPRQGGEAHGRELRDAIEATLSHKSLSQNTKPSIGCSIKWKK